MRVPIIAGNWKMNKTPAEARQLVEAMKDRLAAIAGVEKVLCPPFVDLASVSELVAGTDIGVGA
ncbi:MAG: triose-phosphate isomerase, partial [Anaerolineae bacterium]|nr:triose-phosphate isomerase [Anaerolineae bacterium]